MRFLLRKKLNTGMMNTNARKMYFVFRNRNYTRPKRILSNDLAARKACMIDTSSSNLVGTAFLWNSERNVMFLNYASGGCALWFRDQMGCGC